MSNWGLKTKVGYFLAGASLGAVAALLFAPKSGKETREYIADRAGEGKDYLAERGRVIRRQAGDFVDRGKTYVSRQKDRLAEALKTN
jgi:gas vesicle protein